MLVRRTTEVAVLGARKLLWRTPISRMRVTGRAYRLALKAMYGEGERLAYYKGYRFVVSCDDTAVVPGILGGYYDALQLDIFAEACREATTIFDVGANLGLYAVHAAASAPPGARVHCFEPLPANVDLLRRNLTGNRVEATVHPVAVGAARGYLAVGGGPHRITVPLTTVDDVADDLPPLEVLKIDIDGYEGYALQGAQRTLRRDHPTVFLAYAPRALRAHGFDPARLIEPLRGYSYWLAIDEMAATVRFFDPDRLAQLPARVATLLVTEDTVLVERALSAPDSAILGSERRASMTSAPAKGRHRVTRVASRGE